MRTVFELGDKVQLKTGGPVMEVYYRSYLLVGCKWSDKTYTFREEVLKHETMRPKRMSVLRGRNVCVNKIYKEQKFIDSHDQKQVVKDKVKVVFFEGDELKSRVESYSEFSKIVEL